MKFNANTGIRTIAIMQLSLNDSILFVDWNFTTTIVYHLAALLNGFMFGLVVNEWCQ